MIIYKITNVINNKAYIGQTTTTLNKRIKVHLCDSKTKNYPLYYAIRKYGWSNFKVKVIDIVDNIKVLNEKERYWIEEFSSLCPNGYNLMSGGSHGMHSKKTKHKMSLSRIGHKVSEITRQRISQSNKGRKNSEEHKQKIRKKALGRKCSEETKLKISKANKNRVGCMKGKHYTNETKRKMSLVHIGRIGCMLGKHHTEESKRKISESLKGNKNALKIGEIL